MSLDKIRENSMKDLIIERIIDLGRKSNQPGFEGTDISLSTKFAMMPEKELLTFFELLIIHSHADGYQ